MEEGSTIDGSGDLEGNAASTSDRGIVQAGLMFYPQKQIETCLRVFRWDTLFDQNYKNTLWVGQTTDKNFTGPVNAGVVPELEKTVGMLLFYFLKDIPNEI